MKSKKGLARWFTKSEQSLWFRVLLPLVGVVDRCVNTITMPFGWSFNLEWEFVLWNHLRQARAVGVDTSEW